MNHDNQQPLVSICMPLYNAAEFLDETLSKLNEQTYPNIEVIVVNDHSTDNSLEVAKKYESDRVKIFANKGKGACSARNYAFAQSSGEYIKFMDADDYCTPKLIEAQMNALLTVSKNDLVFSPLKMLYPNGDLILPKRSIDHDYDNAFDLQVEILKFGGFNCPHCYLMPRNLVESSGGWDESILKNQDGEYFSRVLATANSVKCVTDEYVIWRQTGNGVSSKLSLDAKKSMIETYRKIFKLALEKHNSDEMRQICGRYLGLFVFTYYPEIKLLIPKLEAMSNELNISILLPGRRVLKILRSILGWKFSVSLMHQLGMVNRG